MIIKLLKYIVLSANILCISGCGTIKPDDSFFKMPEAERAKILNKSQTPSGFSTIQVKEMSEEKRLNFMSGLIKTVRNKSCNPTSIKFALYNTLSGDSNWDVSCEGSQIKKDYIIQIPEISTGKATIMTCVPDPGLIRCSVMELNKESY